MNNVINFKQALRTEQAAVARLLGDVERSIHLACLTFNWEYSKI